MDVLFTSMAEGLTTLVTFGPNAKTIIGASATIGIVWLAMALFPGVHVTLLAPGPVRTEAPDPDEASIKNAQIAEELALPPVKIHCSVLAEDAIKAAIADYRKKRGQAG